MVFTARRPTPTAPSAWDCSTPWYRQRRRRTSRSTSPPTDDTSGHRARAGAATADPRQRGLPRGRGTFLERRPAVSRGRRAGRLRGRREACRRASTSMSSPRLVGRATSVATAFDRCSRLSSTCRRRLPRWSKRCYAEPCAARAGDVAREPAHRRRASLSALRAAGGGWRCRMREPVRRVAALRGASRGGGARVHAGRGEPRCRRQHLPPSGWPAAGDRTGRCALAAARSRWHPRTPGRAFPRAAELGRVSAAVHVCSTLAPALLELGRLDEAVAELRAGRDALVRAVGTAYSLRPYLPLLAFARGNHRLAVQLTGCARRTYTYQRTGRSMWPDEQQGC